MIPTLLVQLMLPLMTSSPALAAEGVLRHALLVGVNDGGPGMEPLRYAETDARRVEEVLDELGGFDSDQLTLLRDPDRDELQAALRRHAQLAEGAEQDLFLFYYSGHADARGLRVGDELVPYTELRQLIRDIPAEVRLGVLDACRSGEITRLKGLTLSAPFAEETHLATEGEAWLTATSADEAAQESDRIGGSFFTHYLVSGLRGPADAGGSDGGDGIVSLGEAYAYAYDRTVARTGGTDAGTQHPGYDFRLQGRGDLPLTDVRDASAHITLPVDMGGELTVLRLPERTPVAEVAKQSGTEVVLGLPAGRYLLRLRNDSGTSEAQIGLADGAQLPVRNFQEQALELAALKGDEPLSDGVLADAPAVGPSEDDPEPVLEPSDTDWSEDGSIQGVFARSEVVLRRWTQGVERKVTEWAEGHELIAAENVDALADGSIEDEWLGQPEDWREGRQVVPVSGCRTGAPGCLEALVGQLPNGPILLEETDGSPLAMGLVRDGIPTGEWSFLFQDGERHAKGRYANGTRSGTWTWWYSHGKKRQQGLYINGRRSGKWVEWYDNGRQKQKIQFSDDSPAGLQREWYPNGTRKSEGRLLGDLRVDSWTFFHDNGRPRARGSYAGGERTGTWMTWYANGRRASRGEYVGGRKISSWKYWWETGAVSEKGDYDTDLKTGKWRAWHADGSKQATGRYRHGHKDGRWVYWDEQGRRAAKRHTAPDDSPPDSPGASDPAPAIIEVPKTE